MKKILDLFFPRLEIYARRLPLGIELALLGGMGVLFGLASAAFLPPGGMIGFDWINFFGAGRIPTFYPPWSVWVIQFLTWPALLGASLAACGLAIIRRAVHPLSAAWAFFSLPLVWAIFLGQLEGLSLLGLLWLPWLTPLALIKPQVSLFAFGAKKSHAVGLLVFLALTLLVWGMWPTRTLSAESYYGEGRYPQNIGPGLWGVPLALVALWFSRGDPDMLMLAGCLGLPHLIPYNLLPAAPAAARLRPGAAAAATLFSWLPLSANWIGPSGWWLGWVCIAWLWGCLAWQRYRPKK